MTLWDQLVLAGLAMAGVALWWIRKRPLGTLGSSGQLTRSQEKAWEKLKDAGFGLVAGSPATAVAMTVDGRSYDEDARADLLVRRNGRTYIVLMGADLRGARLNTQRHRQQLMALTYAFRPYGTLIYNPDKDTWREVRIAIRGVPGWILPSIAGLLVGLVLGLRISGRG